MRDEVSEMTVSRLMPVPNVASVPACTRYVTALDDFLQTSIVAICLLVDEFAGDTNAGAGGSGRGIVVNRHGADHALPMPLLVAITRQKYPVEYARGPEAALVSITT